jgi:hypothetical protein
LAVENVKKNFLTPTQADTMISVVAWNTEAVKGEVKPGHCGGGTAGKVVGYKGDRERSRSSELTAASRG